MLGLIQKNPNIEPKGKPVELEKEASESEKSENSESEEESGQESSSTDH